MIEKDPDRFISVKPENLEIYVEEGGTRRAQKQETMKKFREDSNGESAGSDFLDVWENNQCTMIDYCKPFRVSEKSKLKTGMKQIQT